ncbi:uncharacterized protein LOC135943020 [Cloeon dipterum]|uniref:uncharacterized protein LOC135943020 n=1 Tax=Cloeon dipterum TaxID=197152 RepID=UPI00321FDD67
MSWLSNYLYCCALGMETLNIDNAAEQLGLTGMTLGKNSNNWKANFNYWTAGTKKGSSEFSWCEPTGPTIFDQGLSWEAGQPDNAAGNESCVHFRFILNSTGTVMTDRNCNSKFIFACKAQRITPTKTCEASCPAKTCTKDASLFNASSGYLLDYTYFGDWYDGCGRFLLTYLAKTSDWTAARDNCCAVGMNLASIESAGKLKCVSRIISESSPRIIGDFWLSGTGSGCDSNFRWCSLGRDFVNSELKWKAGHPKVGLNCVYLEARNESVLLATADCAEQKYFLCEAKKAANSSQLGTQAECADIWNVTSEQIDLLLNVSAFITSSISINLKCFLKCMGVEIGLLQLGGLSGIDMLLQIELVSQEEPKKMEDGFGAFDECSGKKFDDECVTAHEIYKCGLEKQPDMVTKIISNNYDSSSVASPPIPGVPVPRSCWMSKMFPCVADQNAINNLAAKRSDAFGSLIDVGGKTYYKRTINDFPKFNVSVRFAYQHCCALGMRLFEPATLADFDLAKSFYNLALHLIVGETESINRTHEAYCRSRVILADDLYMNPTGFNRYPTTESIFGFFTFTKKFTVTSRENQNIHDMFLKDDYPQIYNSFACV